MIDELPVAPDPAVDPPQVFSEKAAALVLAQRKLPGQMNAAIASIDTKIAQIDAYAAGGAYSFPYIFDSSIANADPGVGRLRFNATNQSAAGVIYIDHQIVGGVNIDSIYAILAAVTNAVKGSIRIVKQADPSRWVLYDVTGAVPGSGFRGLPVVYRSGSGGNPFANGDALLVFIERNGDKGDKGEDAVGALQLLGQATVSTAVAQIDFLNIFSAAYDKYIIELQNITPAAQGILRARLAVGGAVDSSSLYNFPSANSGQGAAVSALDLYSANGTYATMTLEVRNTNGASMTVIGARGAYYSTVGTPGPYSVVVEGAYRGTSTVSGFRLYFSSGNISAGIVRVYGVKNNP